MTTPRSEGVAGDAGPERDGLPELRVQAGIGR